jgi:polyketide synthase 12/myxalamid-type polyketide synthase MxaB
VGFFPERYGDGLIKLALALQHREIPGQLHFERPNPAIPWGDLPVRVAAGRQSWPAAGTPRRGGVSSFGFSGTNVHVVLEEPPADVPSLLVHRPMHVLTVSARQPAALLQVAAGRGDWLRTAADPLADVAHTANAGRSHFAHRIAVVAATAEAARAQLEDHLAGANPAGVHAGAAAGRPPRIAFLFTGQGSQYPGMARELYATQPVFRAAIDRCDDLLATRLPLACVTY